MATMDRLPYGSRRLVAAPSWLPSRQTAMPLLMSGAFTAFLVLLGLTALILVQHRTSLGSTELAQPTTDAGASTEAEAAGPPSISSLSADGMQVPDSVGERAVPDLDEVDHGSDAGLVSTNNLAPPAATCCYSSGVNRTYAGRPTPGPCSTWPNATASPSW